MSLNRTVDSIVIQVIGLLSSINVAKYPHDRPAKNPPAKFIVVNGFCTVPGIMQKFVVNVNCHARNISGNIDRVTLDGLSQSVLALLEEYDLPGELIIEADGEEVFPEPQFNEHSINLRFIVKSINN